jgi:hypothetical protein
MANADLQSVGIFIVRANLIRLETLVSKRRCVHAVSLNYGEHCTRMTGVLPLHVYVATLFMYICSGLF